MATKLSKLAAITGGIAAVITGCTTPKKGPDTAPNQVEELLASVLDHDGNAVGPEALIGHWTVLWFYPKAQTSGWTLEGRGFRDNAKEFEKRGVRIYGVSFDKPAANRIFRQKQGFTYPLWSDTDKALAKHYGVVRTSVQPFASRVTLVLDPRGAVFEVIPNDASNPGPADHATAALAILDRR